MTVTEIGPNEAFTVRIYKYLTTNPTLSWVNTYELFALNEGEVGEPAAAVSALVNFEKAIHLNDTGFDRAVFSTFAEDGVPYDPLSFIVYPLTGTGAVSTVSASQLSLNNCLFVRKTVAAGRSGKLFYRRCLQEADVVSPAGTLALAPGNAVEGRVSDALTNLVDLFGTGNTLRLAMIASGQPVRNITELQVAGARVMQFNNRYFDVP